MERIQLLLFLVLIGLQGSESCGFNTHIEVSMRAQKQLNFQNVDLEKILDKYDGYLHAGSAFPDWGYSCGDSASSEAAHWPPFINAFVEYIHQQDIYNKDIEKFHQLTAFILGVVSHQEADVIWHWGSQAEEDPYDRYWGYSTFQGFLRSMAHLGSFCRDNWNSGTSPTCHLIGDAGGELYLAARSRPAIKDMLWHVPMKEVMDVYHILGYTPSYWTMLGCMNLLYAGAYAEWLVADLAYQFFSEHATFLTEHIHRHYQGGLDDMAYQTSTKWAQVYQALHNNNTNNTIQQHRLFNSFNNITNQQMYQESQGDYKAFKSYISNKYIDLSVNQNTTFSFNQNVQPETVESLRQEYLDYFQSNTKQTRRFLEGVEKTKKIKQYKNGLLQMSDAQLIRQIHLQGDYSYLGSSLGVLNGDQLMMGGAGLIYNKSSRGGVFSTQLYNEQNDLVEELSVDQVLLTGDLQSQMGSEMVIGDLNGDGVEDLVVSMPMFGKAEPGDFSQYQFYTKHYSGKVVIYIGTKDKGVTKDQQPSLTIVNDLTNNTFYLLGHQMWLGQCNNSNATTLILGSHKAYNEKHSHGNQGDVVVFKDIQRLITYKLNNNITTINLTEGIRINQNVSYQLFGKSLACANHHLFIGAPGARHNNDTLIQSTGAVFVYDMNALTNNTYNNNTNSVQPVAAIYCDQDQAQFGHQVRIQNNVLIVSAMSQTNQGYLQAGSIYTFDIEEILTKGKNSLDDRKAYIYSLENQGRFGYEVVVKGDKVLVGQPFHNIDDLYEAGAVYTMSQLDSITGDHQLDHYCQQDNSNGCTLLLPPGFTVQRFGERILIHQQLLIVSAPFTHDYYDVNLHRQAGSVYIYAI